jgi:hypothetical protein
MPSLEMIGVLSGLLGFLVRGMASTQLARRQAERRPVSGRSPHGLNPASPHGSHDRSPSPRVLVHNLRLALAPDPRAALPFRQSIVQCSSTGDRGARLVQPGGLRRRSARRRAPQGIMASSFRPSRGGTEGLRPRTTESANAGLSDHAEFSP